MAIWRTTNQIADLFDVSPSYIRQLVNRGILPAKKDETGAYRFDLEPTIRSYPGIRAPADLSDTKKKLKAEARYKEAKADIAEIQLRDIRDNMHKAEDVKEVFDTFHAAVEREISTFHERVAEDTAKATTAMETAAIIQAASYDVLNELCEWQYQPDNEL